MKFKTEYKDFNSSGLLTGEKWVRGIVVFPKTYNLDLYCHRIAYHQSKRSDALGVWRVNWKVLP